MNRRKSIFITGAGLGIGRETARFFVSKGWFVGLFDIIEENISSLAAEIGEENCFCQVMDVTDIDSVRAAVESFGSATGGTMDVLFNNAGILNMGPHYKIPLDSQKKIVDVNINGILNCINAGFDLLSRTPSSRIVNMSSASSLYGAPELAVYSATKFAVSGITEALNIEFEPHDIIVSDILALYVKTPMIEDAKVQAKSVGVLGIRTMPEDVAKVVWKAANGRKVHWHVGLFLKILVFATWAFPFTNRRVTKLLSFSPGK
jgi:NADP-dependent 3-hydroxy acid dehydrogenase YdfG